MLTASKRLLVVLGGLVGLAYLIWRAVFTLSPDAPILSTALLVLEIHGFVGYLLFAQATWNTTTVEPPEPVEETDLSIAILIPTYNEDQEILLPTVASAVALRPAHRTYLLDDGNRAWVEEMATALGARYIAREDNAHAKAGNLNHALSRIDADLIAVFDADHVPHPDFLHKTIGYFERDPDLALVQTPQDFYNVNSFAHDGDWLEEGLFYRVIQPGKNAVDAAFWCGTSAVLRADALRDVGGVAVDSITEDAHTTLRLLSEGWKTVFHNEVLARGLAPANFDEFETQRERWGLGAMQVLRREGFLTRPRLTLAQRLSFVFTFAGWFDSWRTMGFQLIPLLVLFSGRIPISAPTVPLIATFLLVTAIQQAALVSLGRGRLDPYRSMVFELIKLRASLTATVGLFVPGSDKFKVTPKGRSGAGRRAVPAPLLLRTLFVAQLSAGVWGALSLAGLTIFRYDQQWAAWVAVISCFGNGWLISKAIARITDERFASDRRRAYRVSDQVPGYLGEQACILESFGLAGGRVSIPVDECPESLASVLSLKIGGQVIGFEVEVSRVEFHESEVRISFDWCSDQIDRLGILARAMNTYRVGQGYAGGAEAERERWWSRLTDTYGRRAIQLTR